MVSQLRIVGLGLRGPVQATASKLAFSKGVTIQVHYTDRYGRSVA